MIDGPFLPPPEFYEEMAKDCRCCQECATVPCDGVCAGGMCDLMCRCDDRDDRDDDLSDGNDDEDA
jgi:hypothetical protein